MDLLRQGLSVAKRELDAYVPGATTKIKNIADKAKALALSMSELEMKVMDATNHEPWGPHGKDMQGEEFCGVERAARRRQRRRRERARVGGGDAAGGWAARARATFPPLSLEGWRAPAAQASHPPSSRRRGSRRRPP
jgi:hypothetical protein